MNGPRFGVIDTFLGWLTIPVRPQPVAAFRVLLGVLVLVDCWLVAPELDLWYSDRGIVPQADFAGSRWLRGGFSVLACTGDSPAAVRVLFGLQVAAAALLTIGQFPRIAAATLFVVLTSFAERNPLNYHAGDSLIRLMTLLMVWAPSAAAWSPSSWRRGGPRSWVSPVAFRTMQFQVCLVYATTAIFKALGESWQRGEAVFTVLRLVEFRRYELPTMMYGPAASLVLTWSTLAVEAAFPILIWLPRTRRIMIAAMVLFHLGIEYAMTIRLFEWTLVACMALFVTPEEYRSLAAALRRAGGGPSGWGFNARKKTAA